MTANGLVTHSTHLHDKPLEVLTEWASNNRQNSIIIDTVVANPGRALITYAPTTFNDAMMLDYIRRYGHLNSMTITTISKNQPHGQWLSLYRPDIHDHFSRTDSHFQEQVMPHLIEALDINRIIGQVPSARTDLEMSGARAVARTDGSLYHCGKKFAEILLEVWPDWNSGKLPAELMAAIYPGKESILSEHAIAVSTFDLGNMLFLNIRRISPLHRLSVRELEIARFYGQGQSHKEIGLMLNISPSTVRNLLARVYSKLGIGNKSDLTSLLSKE